MDSVQGLSDVERCYRSIEKLRRIAELLHRGKDVKQLIDGVAAEYESIAGWLDFRQACLAARCDLY